MGKVTTEQIEQDLRALVVNDLRTAYRDIGKAVERAGHGGSALHGLEVVATAFAAVLDTYANPNALNPQGMCDDPKYFRRYFAEIISRGTDTPNPPQRSDATGDRGLGPEQTGGE